MILDYEPLLSTILQGQLCYNMPHVDNEEKVRLLHLTLSRVLDHTKNDDTCDIEEWSEKPDTSPDVQSRDMI